MPARGEHDTSKPVRRPVYFGIPLGFYEWTEEEQDAFWEHVAKAIFEAEGDTEKMVEAAGGPEKAFGVGTAKDAWKPTT